MVACSSEKLLGDVPALLGRIQHAVPDVIVENDRACLLQGLGGRADPVECVDAAAVLLDPSAQAAHLAFDLGEPMRSGRWP